MSAHYVIIGAPEPLVWEMNDNSELIIIQHDEGNTVVEKSTYRDENNNWNAGLEIER